MTDLNRKNKVIALSAFALVSIVLTIQNVLSFTLVFFVCVGLVIFFADKILNKEKIKERTLFAFFVFGVCYQTFFQLFNRVHDNSKQLMVASAMAIFLAAVFSATDSTKFPYSVFSAPLICLLDVRTASVYCVFLLSFSIVILLLESSQGKKKHGKKAKKNKETTKINPTTVARLSIVISIIGIAFCVYYALKNDEHVIENSDFLFLHFKNSFGFAISIIYFLVKLLRSKLNVKSVVIAGLIIFAAATVFFTVNYGWSVFSLLLISANMFLGLVCLESEEITNEIKSDYHNHKYFFLVGLLCLLQ